MRKIAANYIFPVSAPSIKNGTLLLDDHNRVIKIIDNGGSFSEMEGTEFYNGILIPGMVNMHCHLELSYMKGCIDRLLKLPGFIRQVNKIREENKGKSKEEAALRADRTMFQSGISAIGDICNSADTIEIKEASAIYYHNFIEIFGSNDLVAEKALSMGNSLKEMFCSAGLSASVVPHAPYSISPALLRLLSNYYKINPGIISFHNQETADERRLFSDHSGELACLLKEFGTDISGWPAGIRTSSDYLTSVLQDHTIILVHNTYTDDDDVDLIIASGRDPVWCLCPNANIYIEGKLPEIGMFRRKGAELVLGTDSYASNDQLSMLEEMKIIAQYFPEIPLEEMIRWATINGAKVLQIEDKYGSFDAGKTPGVVLIENVDLNRMTLTNASSSRRIV